MFRPYPKSGPKPKKEKKPIKRTPLKKKFKKTGQIEIFEEIAAEREWRCYVTGNVLKELKPINFMHVLAKGLNKYPKMKLHKPNIQLVEDDVHFRWDHCPRSELYKDPRFDKLFDLELRLKREYKLL